MDKAIGKVLTKLGWMRDQRIWPNGLRYLWTDAFGIVLLVSLYQELGRSELLVEAESVVAEVERVLGRPRADELPWKKRYACITCHAVSLLSRKCKTQG